MIAKSVYALVCMCLKNYLFPKALWAFPQSNAFNNYSESLNEYQFVAQWG